MNIRAKIIFAICISLFLLLGTGAASWFGYKSISQKGAAVIALEQGGFHLQMLFRGINESLLTDGTPYSVELARRGIAGFEDSYRVLRSELHSSLLEQTVEQDIGPKWKAVKGGVEPFLQVNAVNPDDDEMMIQYGEVLAIGETLEADIQSAIERLQLDAKLSGRKTFYAVGAIIVVLLLSMFYLQMDIYRAVALPINRLRTLMEDISQTDLGVEKILRDKSKIIEEEFNVKETGAMSHASDIQALASSFDNMIKRLGVHIKERNDAEEALEKLATTDSLTQVHNRQKLDEILDGAAERSRIHNQMLSVIILDLDNFKNINDRYGHLVGDSVLKGVADIVKRNVRLTDHLVRWGGEEFLVVAPGASIREAQVLANKLRALIEENDFETAGRVTASFGLAQFRHEDTGDSFLARADEALYKAKENGRNRVEVCA